MTTARAFFLTGALLLLTGSISAQIFLLNHEVNLADTTQVHVLRTVRGDQLIGRILQLTDTLLIFRMQHLDELTEYRYQELVSADVLGGTMTSELLPDGRPGKRRGSAVPGIESLIYSSTAFPFKRGQGEFRTIDLLYHTVDVGVTDHLSIGGGMVLPAFFMIRLKGTIGVSDRINFGVGSNILFPFIDAIDTDVLSHTYLVATIGQPRAFLNLGFGYGISFGEFGEVLPITQFGGSLVVGKNLRFTLDALIIDEGNFSTFVPSFDIAFFNDRNRFSFGTATIPDADVFFFPLLSYARRISGRKK